MATYYKYAERSADSQVNWAEVGKGISDMLTEEIRLREEKKAAYDEAYREDTKALANAPQGTWQDGNATVNNFAHDMMNQQLIDYRLLKSGVMNERDYTLRRENYKTGTNTVFDLQKILQEKKASTIDLYQKGEIQALNIANMAEVEAYTDFANSKIDIDPYTPNINMSIYETKIIDGKEVRVIKKTSPVNVLKGQLLQTIPTFKLDEAVTKDVESLGDISDYLYDAATITGAGSITKLIGYGAIAGEYAKKDKDGNPLYPQFADSVGRMENALTQFVKKYFTNPYNISSVLTENTGNYSAESYTWDKEEAKGKGKILLKLDPLTGMPVMDENGSHYKEQYQEVVDFTKKLILSKLDAKREFSTTSQSSQLRAGKDDLTPSGPSYAESINQFKGKLKAVPPKRDNYVFTGTEDITVGNLENLFSSDPALIGLGLKVNSANNVVTVTDNDDFVIGSYDLSKTGGINNTVSATNLKERERYLDDLINRVTNYAISKDPTSIGVSLMTGGVGESGGANGGSSR